MSSWIYSQNNNNQGGYSYPGYALETANDASFTPLNLYLSALETDVSLGIIGTIVPFYDPSFNTWDAVANIDISTNIINALFQIGVNDFSFNDASVNDVRYYVDSSTVILDMSNIDISTQSYMTQNPVGLSDISGSNYPMSQQAIKYDFVRYLAQYSFGTHYAVGLFTNKENLVSNIDTVVQVGYGSNIIAKLNSISTTSLQSGEQPDVSGNNYTTDNNMSTNNICRELFLQLMSQDTKRFNPLISTSGRQPLPLFSGDTIAFKLIIQMNDAQLSYVNNSFNVTNASGVSGSGSTGGISGSTGQNNYVDATKRTRTYLVKFNLI